MNVEDDRHEQESANVGPLLVLAEFKVTEPNGNKIGKVTTAGVFTEYAIPTASSSPQYITAGPDGNLWFTEDIGNKIGKVTTVSVFTKYTIPTTGSAPVGIIAGPDGNLWFTESGDKIGKVTTAGIFTEYTIPTASGPVGITVGPDGNLWFTEIDGNKIGRVNLACGNVSGGWRRVRRREQHTRRRV